MTNTLPHTLYSCEQSRAIDQQIIAQGTPGIQLMKRAARAALSLLLDTYFAHEAQPKINKAKLSGACDVAAVNDVASVSHASCASEMNSTLSQETSGARSTFGRPSYASVEDPMNRHVVILCGAGNNAGDGYILAALLQQKNIAVRVFAVARPETLKGDALTAYQYAASHDIEIKAFSEHGAVPVDNMIIVDALLGTGMKLPLRDAFREAVQWINTAKASVLALDLPTGLCGDTGVVSEEAVRADDTLALLTMKQGLVTGKACVYTGRIHYANLGISNAEIDEHVPCAAVRDTADTMLTVLPERSADANKALHGKALIVGGGDGLGGAVLMAAEACLKVGCGLTRLATRQAHVMAMLMRFPEVMASEVNSGQVLQPMLTWPNALLIGPGLGQDAWAEQLFQHCKSLPIPTVLDADALNLLSRETNVEKSPHRVLTPHPGEAARLLSSTIDDVESDRFGAARSLQAKYGGVIVLKGPGTIIASETACCVGPKGSPVLAVGGSGDVLSGVIVSLLAQGLSPCEAARLGVSLHAEAAEDAERQWGSRGVLPTQLIPLIQAKLNAR